MNLMEEVDSIAFESKDHHKMHALSCSYSLRHSHSYLDNVDDQDTKSHNKWVNYKLFEIDFGDIDNNDDVKEIEEFVDDELYMKVIHLKLKMKQFHNLIERMELLMYFGDMNEVLHWVLKQHFLMTTTHLQHHELVFQDEFQHNLQLRRHKKKMEKDLEEVPFQLAAIQYNSSLRSSSNLCVIRKAVRDFKKNELMKKN